MTEDDDHRYNDYRDERNCDVSECVPIPHHFLLIDPVDQVRMPDELVDHLTGVLAENFVLVDEDGFFIEHRIDPSRLDEHNEVMSKIARLPETDKIRDERGDSTYDILMGHALKVYNGVYGQHYLFTLTDADEAMARLFFNEHAPAWSGSFPPMDPDGPQPTR